MSERTIGQVLAGIGLGCVGLTLISVCLFPSAIAGHSEPIPMIHYAPAENLEALDVATLDAATRTIDMAAYLLTDAPVIAALDWAARRGVTIRILFDRGQLEHRPEAPGLIALQEWANVGVRVKRGYGLMHLKAYQVDGRVLRTGSANFSADGLKRQDNDLVLVTDPAAAARFAAEFETIFAQGASE